MMKITPKQSFELTAMPWSPERNASGEPIHGAVGYGIQSSHMGGAMCLRAVVRGDVKQVKEGDYLVFSGGSLVEHLTPSDFDSKYDIVAEEKAPEPEPVNPFAEPKPEPPAEEPKPEEEHGKTE